MKKLIAAIAAAAVLPGVASAELIRMNFEGFATSLGNPSGLDYFAGVETVSGYLVYDNATPTTPFTTTQGRHYNSVQTLVFQLENASGAPIYQIVEDGSSNSNIQVRNLGGLDGVQFIDSSEVPTTFTNKPATVYAIDYSINLSGANTFFSTTSIGQSFDVDWLGAGSADQFQVSFVDTIQGFDNAVFQLTALSFESAEQKVSEPGVLALLGLGLIGLGVARRRG